MSITATTTEDHKVIIADTWLKETLCTLDITSAVILARDILRIAVANKVRPTMPMPEPAVGMRVWLEFVSLEGWVDTYPPIDVKRCGPGMDWGMIVNNPENITLITDYRKGDEVIWERK